MGFLLGVALVLVALLGCAALIDRRTRRRRGRAWNGSGLRNNLREMRRDALAWDRGTLGNSGQDVSWMKAFRRTDGGR